LTPAEPAIRYRVGNLEIDPSQRRIARNGESIHPRQRVFRLLMYLMENRGRVVSKEELVARVWDDAALSDSVLYKTVLELRRVVEENPEEPALIKTVPKAGYQFTGVVQEERTDPSAAAPAVPGGTRRWTWRAAALAVAGIAILAGLILAIRGVGPRILPDTEVAWWRMDEASGRTVRDMAGHNDGRLVAGLAGTVPRWSPGLNGRALAFDSGGGYAEGPFPALRESPVSLCAWVKLRPLKQGQIPIFDCPAATLFIGLRGLLSVKEKNFGMTAGTPISDDQWHHVAFVNEGSYTNTVRLFVDGAENANGIRAAQPATGSRWRAGRFLAEAGNMWGLMKDVRVYARPLRALELEAIYRCGKESPDIAIAGRRNYYLPVFPAGATVESDGTIRNPRLDYSGVQFAESGRGGCGVNDLRGADLGQDLRIGLEVRVPGDAEGRTTQAGPYFRSRAAYPGDGLAGGTSSGYWVRLSSTGEVTVWQLNPYHPVATSRAARNFDSEAFHGLTVEARGATLRVWMDGNAVAFDAAGYSSETVEIVGSGPGHGSAGVAFANEENRGTVGGQQARNLTVEALH